MNTITEQMSDIVAPSKSEADLKRIVDQVDAVVTDLRKALGIPGRSGRTASPSLGSAGDLSGATNS